MDRRDDNFKGGQFSWFTGEVLKVHKDGTNRVKVFPHGYYDDKFNDVKEADKLPWATVMMPPTTPGIGTSDVKLVGATAGAPPVFKSFGDVQGMNHSLEVGTWVVGFFRDGPSAQDPIVMGVITGKDIPGVREDVSQYSEGGTFTASDTNKVMTTTGKHAIALNNESGDATVHTRNGKLKFSSGRDTDIKIDGQIPTIDIEAEGTFIKIDGNTGNITIMSGLNGKVTIL